MPREYYQLNDIQDLGELNRIFDSISRRLNYLVDSGDNLSAGDQRIVSLADSEDDQDAVTRAQFGILLQLHFGFGLSVEVLGTTDEITVTKTGSGTYTISLPGSIKLDGATASRLLATDGSKKTVSVADLASWIAGATNEITVTNDADGTITLSIPSGAIITFANEGIHILDTNASHDLILKAGSDLTADRILTLTTGDVARTITLSGNPTLADWFDQAVKQASSPTFAGLTKVGDASNYTTIAADGEISLFGTARVYDGHWLGTTDFKEPTVGEAQLVNRGYGVAFEFTDNQDTEHIHTQFRIPSKWVDTEDITIILLWDSPTVSQDCDWEINYQFKAANEDMTDAGLTGTATDIITSSGTANGLVETQIAIPAADFNAGDKVIRLTIYRDGDDVADTLGDSAFLHGLLIRGTANKFGGST